MGIKVQYHEVKFIVEFRDAAELVSGASGATAADADMTDASIWVDYIYLDTDERRRFAQTAHEYLIDQLQFQGSQSVTVADNDDPLAASTTVRSRMDFNHPTKFIAWVLRANEATNEWNNYSTAAGYTGSNYGLGNDVAVAAGVNPVRTALVQLNGHDRFDVRGGDYFNLVQPYQHFPHIPTVGVNVYSFGLNPTEHQPSGTCNFSRIDNATLNLTLNAVDGHTSANLFIYAVNFNVLRITSGMGGLAYSN